MTKVIKKPVSFRKGLRYKLALAFGCMAIIPLLICAYIVSIYIFSQSENFVDVSILVLISLAVSLLGLELAKRLIDPVIEMARKARRIAGGEYSLKFNVKRSDEIGLLAESINKMAEKIRSTLDDLKDYADRSGQIGAEINKKTLALCNLLYLSERISAGVLEIDAVLELALNKTSIIFDKGFGILFLEGQPGDDYIARVLYNAASEKLNALIIRFGEGPLGMAMRDHASVVIDSRVALSKDIEDFKVSYSIKNIIAVPIYTARRGYGMLVVGNKTDDYAFTADDLDIMKIFAKQISIALEKDILARQAKELTIKDDMTGLYNRSYIMTVLEEEIKRSIFHQRPCSFVLVNIDGLNKFCEAFGEDASDDTVRKVARLVRDGAAPMGKAARVGWGEFALVLPEKGKAEASQIAEEILKRAELTKVTKGAGFDLAINYSVSENLVDGSTCDELFKKAAQEIAYAKPLGKV